MQEEIYIVLKAFSQRYDDKFSLLSEEQKQEQVWHLWVLHPAKVWVFPEKLCQFFADHHQ